MSGSTLATVICRMVCPPVWLVSGATEEFRGGPPFSLRSGMSLWAAVYAIKLQETCGSCRVSNAAWLRGGYDVTPTGPVFVSPAERARRDAGRLDSARVEARRQLRVVEELQGLGVATDELNAKAKELRDVLHR